MGEVYVEVTGEVANSMRALPGSDQRGIQVVHIESVGQEQVGLLERVGKELGTVQMFRLVELGPLVQQMVMRVRMMVS